MQLVDVARGMTPADLADGIHPNAGGYAKLAAACHAALRPLFGGTRAALTPSPAWRAGRQSALYSGRSEATHKLIPRTGRD